MYKYCTQDKRCFEITVEQPTDAFLQMRDTYDIQMLLENDYFSVITQFSGGKLAKNKITKENFDSIALDKKEAAEIERKLKLSQLRVGARFSHRFS